jgi:hAT family C-terminal dimerisation region
MTDDQYRAAEEDLISRLQSMREADSGSRTLMPMSKNGSDEEKDNLDDVYDSPVSSEYQAAQNEWFQYCRIVKTSRKLPKKLKNDGSTITVGEIEFGVVEERGQDLEASYPFKKCNLADFVDKTGYFDLVRFLKFNEKSFPFLYKLACCLACLRMNEVGCERFFSIAGYVSNPRRTSLKVRHYECLAMLKRNLQQVYIDENWVVQQYMTLEKTKAWGTLDTRSDLLVTALEQEQAADDLGVPVDSIAIGDLEGNNPGGMVDVIDTDDDATDSE